jgi:osmotically-inducible protein OsmY
VRGVENTIDVTYAAERPDAEIADDVAHALRWDARLGHAPIDVAVEDGVVMLSGSVGSAFAKRLAIDRARVSGVTNVTADALEVRGWDRDDALRRNAVADTSDVQVRRAVEAALRQDPRTAPFAIEVEADDGVAVLSGTVDNLKARRAAAQTASHTLGVQAVRNTLTVEPTTSVSDTDLKFDVAEALAVNPYTDRLEISILVDDGAVTLNGQADTYFEKWEAGNVVAHVPGVTGVTNALDVDLDQPTHESRFYDWDPVYTDYDYRYGYEADYPVSDDALRESIAREMRWSPSLDRSEITMSIEDGVVTLRGTIDSWYARARATEEAYEGGAASVVNSLEVVR